MYTFTFGRLYEGLEVVDAGGVDEWDVAHT